MASPRPAAAAPSPPRRWALSRARASLRSFRHRSRAEHLLVLEALPVVILVRLGLTLLGYRRLDRLLARPRSLARPPDRQLGHAADAAVARVGWAVATAARAVPRATCLTQAVAARWLLARRGRPALLSIGVAPRPGGGIEAHAWLVSGARIVTGGPAATIARYTVLARLDA